MNVKRPKNKLKGSQTYLGCENDDLILCDKNGDIDKTFCVPKSGGKAQCPITDI